MSTVASILHDNQSSNSNNMFNSKIVDSAEDALISQLEDCRDKICLPAEMKNNTVYPLPDVRFPSQSSF
jgi:hypothetical protein